MDWSCVLDACHYDETKNEMEMAHLISDFAYRENGAKPTPSYFLNCFLPCLQVEFNRGEAYAVKTDIECTNGHIHIIDGVLTPQAGTTIPVK